MIHQNFLPELIRLHLDDVREQAKPRRRLPKPRRAWRKKG